MQRILTQNMLMFVERTVTYFHTQYRRGERGERPASTLSEINCLLGHYHTIGSSFCVFWPAGSNLQHWFSRVSRRPFINEQEVPWFKVYLHIILGAVGNKDVLVLLRYSTRSFSEAKIRIG